MSKVSAILIVILFAVICVSAQSESNRKGDVEGKPVNARYVISVSSKPGVVQLGPRTTYLKEGLSMEEVLRVMGKPAAVSKRNEEGAIVTSYEFKRGDGRVLIAEFIDNTLVRSRTETAGQAAPLEGLGN